MLITGRSAFPNAQIAFRPTDNLSIDDIKNQFESASATFTNAFRQFAVQTIPVYTTSTVVTSSSDAMLSGISARTSAVQGVSSVLQTTVGVNTQTSTVRSSSSAIGLNLTSASSTITSTAKMDTAATAYGSSILNFTGGLLQSTSTGTLSGTYTGVNTAANATSLKVVVTTPAVLNTTLATNVQFQVQDQSGNVLFTYNGNVKAGDQIYLGSDIGLSISFSAGQLSVNASASTTVGHGPFNVDPNAAFNNADPRQRPQFDNNAQVTAGSFTINGTTITVNANDTINTVLATINSSGAGVTASLANDKITLTTNAASQSNIVLANDTSGFLSAAKLAGATTVQGHIADNQKALSQTTQFASVVSGSFNVNGVAISINKDTDTLTSIINRINSSNTGVTASYDSTNDKVVFTPNTAGATLSLDSDTTGFLSAAKVATGTVGTQANPNAAFNATGMNGPLFDPGNTVQAGSFQVNGITISVNANDTINTVLARITASSAGVTATYNASTQTINLVSNQPSTSAITVGNDTSGFLAAVKLDGTAKSTPGFLYSSAFDSALNHMTEYSSVHAGTVSVNGHAIAIDPASTTINAFVSALNNIPDISASVDQTTGKISISAKRPGVAIQFSDTSGLLSTLGIASGTYNGPAASVKIVQTQTGTTTTTNADSVAASVSAAAAKVNDTIAKFDKFANAKPELRSEIQTAVRNAINALTWSGMQGVTVDTSGGDTRILVEHDKLSAALAQNPAQLGDSLQAFTNQINAFANQREPQLSQTDIEQLQSMNAMVAASAQQMLNQLRFFNSWGSSATQQPSAKQAMQAYRDQMTSKV